MTPYSKKLELLDRLWHYTEGDERYESFRKSHNIAFPVMAWINRGLVTPTSDLVEKNVDYLWEEWLKLVGVEDTGNFETVLDVDPQLDEHKPYVDLMMVIGEYSEVDEDED